MDDSGLRERVASITRDFWERRKTSVETADAILALVDAEYRPLLVLMRDAMAHVVHGVRDKEAEAGVLAALDKKLGG